MSAPIISPSMPPAPPGEAPVTRGVAPGVESSWTVMSPISPLPVLSTGRDASL